MALGQSNPWAFTYGSDTSVATQTLAAGETGSLIMGPGWTDRSVQFEGVFGGATAVLEGSNNGTNFHTLSNPKDGSLISFTSGALCQVLEIVVFMRFRASGGDGTTAIACTLCMTRHP